MATVPFTTATLTLIVLTLTIFLFTMPFFRRKNYFPVASRTAIVTGGSQGLGLSVAKLLSSKGANVVIIAQDVSKLESAVAAVAAAASSPNTQKFLHLSFDLRDPSSAPTILERATAWNTGTPPDIIFNCAGHCLPGFFASSPISQLRSQMDTIYWSSAYMAHAALNLWLKPSSGKPSWSPPAGASPTPAADKTRHIIFTSSTLAFFPIAGYAPYSPAKAAMKSLADTLAHEVAVYNGTRSSASSSSTPPPPADIKVHTLYPMGILTPGYEHENTLKPPLTVKLEESDKPQNPDEVARIAIARLERGDEHITTMLIGHLLRGVGMGASVRKSIVDVFWNLVGGVVWLVVGPEFLGKCRDWGRERGMEGARYEHGIG